MRLVSTSVFEMTETEWASKDHDDAEVVGHSVNMRREKTVLVAYTFLPPNNVLYEGTKDECRAWLKKYVAGSRVYGSWDNLVLTGRTYWIDTPVTRWVYWIYEEHYFNKSEDFESRVHHLSEEKKKEQLELARREEELARLIA